MKILKEAISQGVYSLYNGWVTRPEPNKVKKYDISKEVAELTAEADSLKRENDFKEWLDKIYVMRQESLLKEGEYSKGNLIFKELRNQGVIKKVKDAKTDYENRKMSVYEGHAMRAEQAYRWRAGLGPDDIITEDNINEKALTEASCYINFDYNDLYDYLLGRD